MASIKSLLDKLEGCGILRLEKPSARPVRVLPGGEIRFINRREGYQHTSKYALKKGWIKAPNETKQPTR